jgi:hypothetical protein
MHIKFTCSYKLNIYNNYSKSYTKTHSNLASWREEAFGALTLLRLLVGILLPPVIVTPHVMETLIKVIRK